MNDPIIHISNKTTTGSTKRRSLRRGSVLMVLAAAWFALSPLARAVNPPPDGGYPNANTAEGEDALSKLTIGIDNTAIGFNALFSNTRGNENTAVGFDALFSNTIGQKNTAMGVNALLFNTRGEENTAMGVNALLSNTTGGGNTAIGLNALVANKTGGGNVAIGADALFNNTTGGANTASGVFALGSNTTGFFNTATGNGALFNNTTGSSNTASGGALSSNTTGNNNTADGDLALALNETGSDNTAVGSEALRSNRTGSNNVGLGVLAGASITTGSNDIDIGTEGVADESNTIRIGRKGTHNNTFIAGISGVTVAGGVEVIVGANGHLGTVTSSERYKDGIKPMDKASEAILALKPVAFRYKHELDPAGIPQFGLVAEQVEKVNPDLVARDEQGKAYTVRYDSVNAMLLNEFLKEHRKVEEQQTTIHELRSAVAQEQKQIQALTAGLQKVSDQIELNKTAAQVATNHR